jgi:hypothetical protein
MLVRVTLVTDESRRTIRMTPEEAQRLRTNWLKARFNWCQAQVRANEEYEVADDAFGTTSVRLPLSEASLLLIGRLLPQEGSQVPF